MATWSNLNLQDKASPLMEQLMFFHDHTLMILTLITILVGYLMFSLFFSIKETNYWSNLNNFTSYYFNFYCPSITSIIMFISRN